MKFWFDTLRSRLLLTLVTYALYLLLYIATDSVARDYYLGGGYPAWGYVIDIVTTLVMIFLFVQLSIFYSRAVHQRLVSTAHPYGGLMAYSVTLLLLNNLVAYVLARLTGYLFFIDGLPFLQVQHIYVYATMAAFISGTYTSAYYLHQYMIDTDEKKRLETVAMQEKMNALKQQIDPHFMFNNFSILSELIVEDGRLAVKFLDNLSKVYRYVIGNHDKDTVALSAELAFLDSYMYLMSMRYEDAVIVSVSGELRNSPGRIPPVSLQLLVENALKHNRFSATQPLLVRLSVADGCVVVSNTMHPLASPTVSTGVGLSNITARYALLCNRKPRVSKADGVFTFYLPIITDALHE